MEVRESVWRSPKKLSAEGNRIIINGRDEERLQNALKDLGKAEAISGDLSVETERVRIADKLKTDHPDINIIITNAGAAFVYPLSQTANAYQKASIEMNTNYLAVIHFTELLLPHLLEKQEAAIINVSSNIAFGTFKLLPTYGPSKAALHSYTISLRETYQDKPNLQVYEVYPPYTDKIKDIFSRQTPQQHFAHAARQSYIELAMAVAQAAELKIDSTPAEGFDNGLVDEALDLKSMGLKSVTLLYLGYRAEDDWLAPLKKVRNPTEDFVITYN